MIALAADLGGTRIKLGVVDGGKVLASDAIDAEAERGLGVRLPMIARVFRELYAKAGVPFDRCGGVGMAVPCIVTPDGKRITTTPKAKYEDAVGMDLDAWARKELGVPAIVCNDANAAMMGEWNYGGGRGCRSVVMVTLGTGIGTSAVIDGVPLRGQHGVAGILGGHVTANVEGGDCICGNRGCFETEASSWALKRRLGDAVDFRAIFEAAERGDARAAAERDRNVRVWSACVVTLVHMYDPEAVVIGGGVMRSADVILPRIQEYVDRHAFVAWGRVVVKKGELGDDAALLGMGALAAAGK